MGSIRRLGTVLHISKSSGNLILKGEKKVKIGNYVFDQNENQIGIVFDIFGSVSSPYIAVKPSIKEVESLIDKTLLLKR